MHAHDQPNEAEYPAEEEHGDDGENHIVGRLDLNKHSVLYRARLSHHHVAVVCRSGSAVGSRLGRWRSTVACMHGPSTKHSKHLLMYPSAFYSTLLIAYRVGTAAVGRWEHFLPVAACPT